MNEDRDSLYHALSIGNLRNLDGKCIAVKEAFSDFDEMKVFRLHYIDEIQGSEEDDVEPESERFIFTLVDTNGEAARIATINYNTEGMSHEFDYDDLKELMTEDKVQLYKYDEILTYKNIRLWKRLSINELYLVNGCKVAVKSIVGGNNVCYSYTLDIKHDPLDNDDTQYNFIKENGDIEPYTRHFLIQNDGSIKFYLYTEVPVCEEKIQEDISNGTEANLKEKKKSFEAGDSKLVSSVKDNINILTFNELCKVVINGLIPDNEIWFRYPTCDAAKSNECGMELHFKFDCFYDRTNEILPFSRSLLTSYFVKKEVKLYTLKEATMTGKRMKLKGFKECDEFKTFEETIIRLHTIKYKNDKISSYEKFINAKNWEVEE